MNRRFHEVARQQNNINVDRSFFNANTRQDKNWAQQSQQPHQKFRKDDINADRQFFNISTNDTYHFIDTDRQLAERQFNDYTVANSMRNKSNYSNDGQRITHSNTRNDKEVLDTEEGTFVQRSVNTNPYAHANDFGVTRIQAIDTKNGDSNTFKQESSKKNKFNPYAIY